MVLYTPLFGIFSELEQKNLLQVCVNFCVLDKLCAFGIAGLDDAFEMQRTASFSITPLLLGTKCDHSPCSTMCVLNLPNDLRIPERIEWRTNIEHCQDVSHH